MTKILSLFDRLVNGKYILATAESCTGGLIAAAFTDTPGSSVIFERGFVTYCNTAKVDLLGVSEETLKAYGAVSEQTCREMLLGAIKNSNANTAIATTGIAGPDGGSAEKPVGLVYIGVYVKGRIRVVKHHFSGNRKQIRAETVDKAIELLTSTLA